MYFMLGPVEVGKRVLEKTGLHRHRLSSAPEYLEYKGRPAL